MNTFLKTCSALCLTSLLVSTSFAAEVTEVDVSSDPVFSQNSCDQAFIRTPNAVVGDNISNMKDSWKNKGNVDQVLYKEEQTMPKIIFLGGANWKEVKVSDAVNFWNYSTELETIYSNEEEGYVLGAGKNINWIESSLGSAYQLTANTSQENSNIGLIVYDIVYHNMPEGVPEVDTTTHRECVLIKSGAPGQTPITPAETPKELPQTGPEHILLAIISLLLGSGLFFMNRKTV